METAGRASTGEEAQGERTPGHATDSVSSSLGDRDGTCDPLRHANHRRHLASDQERAQELGRLVRQRFGPPFRKPRQNGE
jgi:hypothetical protein